MINPNKIDFNQILIDAKASYKTIIIDFIITNEDDAKILIQKRSLDRKTFPNKWEITGGKLEENETIVECIEREMREECQMKLDKVMVLAHKFVWQQDNSVINLQFLVKASGQYTPEEGKVSEHKWIDIKSINILQDDYPEESDIYKGAFYSFGFLESFRNQKEKLNYTNFKFINFLEELISNFYKFNNISATLPKIIIESLPDGSNIHSNFEKNTLHIDIKLLTKTNIFFSSIVILHDLYHNMKQGILSHDDVLTIRDVFGDVSMLFMDIDADIEIYKFLAEYYSFDFNKYLETLHDGAGAFKNTVARMPKLQRFMGSVLSIYQSTLGSKIIYFPSLTKLHNSMFILSLDGNVKFNKISIKNEDLEHVMKVFQSVNEYKKEEFVSIIRDFCKKLTLKIKRN